MPVGDSDPSRSSSRAVNAHQELTHVRASS
jgi:hypothetical protein